MTDTVPPAQPEDEREVSEEQLSLGRRLRQPRTILSLVLPIVLLVLIPLGSMHYRCAGHDGSDSFGLDLRHDHRMLHELNIHATCPLPVNRPGGWWPDVLPE